MIRNLKTLTLALGAILAFGAIAGAAAQEEESSGFTAAKYPATLTAEQVYEEEVHHDSMDPEKTEPVGHVFDGENRFIMCKEVHFLGESIEGPAAELTVEPTYSDCGFLMGITGTVPVTIETNGCIYHLRVGNHLEAGTFDGEVDLSCPPEQGIDIHIYATPKAHAEASPLCSYRMGPQEFSGLHFENHAPTNTTLKFASKLQWTKTFGGIICGAVNQTWQYEGTSLAEFTDQIGAPVKADVGTLE